MSGSPSLETNSPPFSPQYRQSKLSSFWEFVGSTTTLNLKPSDGIVLSLFDESAISCDPWLDLGFECHIIAPSFIDSVSTCNLSKLKIIERDIESIETLERVFKAYSKKKIAFICAFPPSDELSIAGARWFAGKKKENPDFQNHQVERFPLIEKWFKSLSVPYFIQSPHSPILTKLFRRPNLTYQPCHFGGYLEETEDHPRFPGVVPNRDAFTSMLAVFAGGKFRHPRTRPTEPIFRSFVCRKTGKIRRLSIVLYSRRHRSARRCPPRGFLRACCAALT